MRISLELPASTDEWIRSTQTMSVDLTAYPASAGFLASTVENPEPSDLSAAEWSGFDIRWHYLGDLAPGVYGFWISVAGATIAPKRLTGFARLL